MQVYIVRVRIITPRKYKKYTAPVLPSTSSSSTPQHSGPDWELRKAARASPESVQLLGDYIHAKIDLGAVLPIFSGAVTMSHFPANSVIQAAQLSFQGRGQLHGLLQNASCLKKTSRFHVGFCREIFLQASNLSNSQSQTGNLLSTRLVRSWFYTFLRSIRDKFCAQETGPGCLLFHIFTSVF